MKCSACGRENGHDTRCRIARSAPRSWPIDGIGAPDCAVEVTIFEDETQMRIVEMKDARGSGAGCAVIELSLLRAMLEEITARRTNEVGGRAIVDAIGVVDAKLDNLQAWLRSLAAASEG